MSWWNAKSVIHDTKIKMYKLYILFRNIKEWKYCVHVQILSKVYSSEFTHHLVFITYEKWENVWNMPSYLKSVSLSATSTIKRSSERRSFIRQRNVCIVFYCCFSNKGKITWNSTSVDVHWILHLKLTKL